MPSHRLLPLVLVGALALAACSDPAGEPATQSTTSTVPTPSDTSAPVVAPNPAGFDVTPASSSVRFYPSSTVDGLYAVACLGEGPSLAVRGELSNLSSEVSASSADGKTLLTFPAGDGAFEFDVSSGDRTSRVRVRCLPPGFPNIRVDGTFSDWMTLATDGPYVPYLMVLDPSGFPAWFQQAGSSFSDLFVDDGDLIAFSTETRSHWGFNTNPGLGFRRIGFDGTVKTEWALDDPTLPVDQHAVALLPTGNALSIVYERVEHSYMPLSMLVVPSFSPVGSIPCPENPDFTVTPSVRGRLVEITPQGEAVKIWRIEEFLPESPVLATYVNLASAVPGGFDCVLDPDHLNTVVFYQTPDAPPGVGQVMLMGRHNNAAILIDWPSGQVVWTLGGAKGPKALTIVDDPYGDLFIPHDAHFIAGDLVLVYDNRYTEPARAVIYRIDLIERTATLVSSAEVPCGDESCFADAMGSSRLTLDGGGLLIGSGTGTTTAVEYSFDGERIGEYPYAQLVVEGGYSYRVLPAPPLDAVELFEAQSRLPR